MANRKVMVKLGGLALAAILTILSPATIIYGAEVTSAETTDENNTEENNTAEDTEEAEDFDVTDEALWAYKLMARVNDNMNIRSIASTSGDIIGKLCKGEIADVISESENWTLIEIHGQQGYVSKDYTVSGEEAYEYMMEEGCMMATVTANDLRIREDASLAADVIGRVSEGANLKVATEVEAPEGWVAINYGDRVAYVDADYVKVAFLIANATGTYVTQDGDEALLAALLECEAGGTSYEGLLAVASVVMNRIESDLFPNTLYEVIYQKSQFTPAMNGKVARVLESGSISEDAYAAARAALGGARNTDCLFFNSARGGHKGTIIGGNVFF